MLMAPLSGMIWNRIKEDIVTMWAIASGSKLPKAV